MLIAEELFLLLRRDDGKAESAFAQNAYGLVGALLTDLVLSERITLSDDKDPRVRVVDAAPTGHPVLDPALARLQTRDGKLMSSHITDGKLNPEEHIGETLAAAGIVLVEPKRALGMVPAKYPVLDPGPERAVRQRLASVLAGASPQPADASLLAILQGLQIAAKVLEVEKGAMRGKDLKRRIEEVSDQAVAGLAVGKAVQAMNVAMMTAVFIPVVVTGSG